MIKITKPTPIILRQLEDLRVLGNPRNAPAWLIPKYIADCIENKYLQSHWNPKVGDWYLCTDLFSVMQIESISGYYSSGDLSLATDFPIGSISNGGCDFYIPNPRDLEKILISNGGKRK